MSKKTPKKTLVKTHKKTRQTTSAKLKSKKTKPVKLKAKAKKSAPNTKTKPVQNSVRDRASHGSNVIWKLLELREQSRKNAATERERARSERSIRDQQTPAKHQGFSRFSGPRRRAV